MIGGWCSTDANYKCPASNKEECDAQNGDWCVSSGMSSTTASAANMGWCNSVKGSCPVNDKATCTAKGRKWCSYNNSSSTTTTPMYSNGWCANVGEKCPDDNNVPPPVPPPTPPITMSWPNTQTECDSYSGRWCANNYGGYCQMATRKCPPQIKTGYMMCWDNSMVSSGSTCPDMPTTETACLKTGKHWCANMAAVSSALTMNSGWCSNETCMVMPPAGMMICPDGVSSAKKLTDCPKGGLTLPPPPEPVRTIDCPDGERVPAGIPCPVYIICEGGVKDKSKDQFPKPDEISDCRSNGGSWCSAS